MKVLVLAPYASSVASTRARAESIVVHLNASGVDAALLTALGSTANRWWLSGGTRRLLALVSIAVAGLRGLWKLRSCDCIVVQREALPLNTLLVERAAVRRRIPLIWDIDDALWHHRMGVSRHLRGSSSKYEWLARHASCIWTGSSVSMEWAVSFASGPVHRVPTALPVADLPGQDDRDDGLLVWIGTPSTATFIEDLIERIGHHLEGWRLLVVGAEIRNATALKVDCVPWSPRMEREALLSASVGLYPLGRSDFIDGKSGGKAILYMSYGLPQVVSDAPSISEIMIGSEAGLIASGDGDWVGALRSLRDPEIRRQMGTNGLRHAREYFDIVKWNDWKTSCIEDLMGRRL